MELLYKAYTSSLNASKPPNEEEAQEVAKPFLFEKTQTDQTASTNREGLANPATPNLSEFPLKDPDRVKSAIAKLRAEKIKQVEESQ